MAIEITIDDLRPFDSSITVEKADAMISGAVARAALVAPCILDDDFADLFADAAKSILVRTILRWHQAKPGNISQETRGPFSVSYQDTRELFWPSELEELQTLCKNFNSDGSSRDTAAPSWFFGPSDQPAPLPDWVTRLAYP